MSEIALAKINSFAPVAQQAEVSPEEPIFITIPATALQDLLGAIQSLNDEVQSLKATVANLESKVSTLEATQDTQGENQFIQLRLINDLRKDKEPQPMQTDRGEILRALLVANGGKMLATDARKKMHLSRSRFSILLATMKDDIETRPYHLNKSWQVLVLR
jgi:hypothetical protein